VAVGGDFAVDVEDAPVVGGLMGQPERRDGVSRLPLVRERVGADRMPTFGLDWLMSGSFTVESAR